MARSKREIAAKLFKAGLFDSHIRALLIKNRHKPPEDPRGRYVEIFIRKDTTSLHFSSSTCETLFRFFCTMEEWEKKIFIPNQGLTPGQAMKLIEQYWDRRVCGPDPWGIEK